ncbi:MAG: SUMF1/EgtB/PvdO family nonheme iron enzyme, partial [Thermoguttaceae bacterium]
CALNRGGYDNEIAALSPLGPQGTLSTLYKPEKSLFVGDVDLHFDAEKMIFSMRGENNRWQIWEIGADGKNLRQVTSGEHKDVDNYDPCYLPGGRIVFGSTACFQGVPCVGGGNTVANLFIMNADGSSTRQLCFDQDHDWSPAVLNNGRVLYTRWEYSDSPHYFTRILFHMNPDGTNQMEYYGSNSNWPNSFFYARPIPNHSTMVVAIISGHHGVSRMGEMVLFDPARGRHEAKGAVQRIPGYGKEVKAVTGDQIVDNSWPKFLHPYPLSDKYFLAASKPNKTARWGIYLVDIFDNMVLLREEPGYVLFEPVPLRKTKSPPLIADKVDTSRQDAVVYLQDVHFGRAMAGVPRGTVKQLRIFEQHYAYPKMGGHISIGIDGPWDAKRIIGTVPVEADGSASFRVPANTPIALQPLDGEGKAVQLMRSWLTAMPGEVISCVGCHEDLSSTPPARMTKASLRAPSEITPWHGPPRGFGFRREVQPVLDKYCLGCHNGEESGRPNFAANGRGWKNFTPAYVALHPYVRRPGPESDYHLQKPLEFHANTSELIQMLEKGHHNVKLDAEAWDRLITWIDLNVPDKGTWHEHRAVADNFTSRRAEMRKLYANIDVEPEAIAQAPPNPIKFVEPEKAPPRKPQNLKVAGWPFDAAEAARRQQETGLPVDMKLPLAGKLAIGLKLIPPGTFVMGDEGGAADEYPTAVVKIEKPFYMADTEVTNTQFALFDASHDSAYISMTNKDQGSRGHAVNGANQPVVRVTWKKAVEFCQWLSAETGKNCSLPSEAQWEWASRAGTDTPFSYGTIDNDFSKFANLADRRMAGLARRDSPRWHLRDDRFDDRAMVTSTVGRYGPNAWGLRDMHGNAAEWTRTAYRPYPFDAADGRDAPAATGTKSVRGGSWYDRPKRATSAFRMNYQPWQHVYNVGFRIIVEP